MTLPQDIAAMAESIVNTLTQTDCGTVRLRRRKLAIHAMSKI